MARISGLMMLRSEHFFSIPTSMGTALFTTFHMGILLAVFTIMTLGLLRCLRKKTA